MPHAPVYVSLTSDDLQHVKRALRAHLPDVQSSHLTEALAAALGRKTHAALLFDLSAARGDDNGLAPLDEDAFTARLAELTGRPFSPRRSPAGLFHDLTYPSGAAVIRTWSPGFDRVSYDVPRRRAWRNMMVAAINAGIDQRLFSMRAGDNRWPGADLQAQHRHAPPHPYRFEVGGIPAVAAVDDGGYGEVRLYVAFWPTENAERGLDAHESALRAGAAYATGWLERRDGAYLQVPAKLSGEFHCRNGNLATIAALEAHTALLCGPR